MTGYTTVSGRGSCEIVINKSRFIAYTDRVETQEQAQQAIVSQRELYPDATHHCYAYIVAEQGIATRHSDDGEPSGTAGLPILEAIKGAGLINTVVVVTRYFGGTLLGTGGLVRAYSSSTSAVLAQMGSVKFVKCGIYSVEIQYPEYSKILYSFEKYILRADFTDKVFLEMVLPVEQEERMLAQINNICLGKVIYNKLKEDYCDLKESGE